jgi:REP-associated tyrosine transposase
VQHLIQRGNNRQVCFTCDADRAAYANWLWEAAEKYQIAVHAWVFMTNHVHLLVTPGSEESIALAMQYIGRFYVRYFNQSYSRSGTLYEGRYKSHLVQDLDYVLACQRYIELNPVRAGMVSDPADYVWSSYRSAAFGRATKLWEPHRYYLELGETNPERRKKYRTLFTSDLDEEVIDDIRHAVKRGLILGNERFREQVGLLHKQSKR